MASIPRYIQKLTNLPYQTCCQKVDKILEEAKVLAYQKNWPLKMACAYLIDPKLLNLNTYEEDKMPKAKSNINQISVTAKCVECGNKRDIGPSEVPKDQMPMCDKCYGVMVAVKATAKKSK
jgi:Zn finger protein HypA/HybF involved in hydrogenase expression